MLKKLHQIHYKTNKDAYFMDNHHMAYRKIKSMELNILQTSICLYRILLVLKWPMMEQ